MITENAIVVSIANDQTWIETQRKSTCGQCNASKGCGTSVLSKVIGNKLTIMKAINNINAKVGDEVLVGLNEQSLLKGSFMAYLLPLIYIFIFSFFAQLISKSLELANSELLIIGFAIMGFYLALRKLKRFSTSIAENENYQPVILKKTNSSVFVNL